MYINNTLIIRGIVTIVVIILLITVKNISLRFVKNKHYENPDVRMRAVSLTKRVFFGLIIMSITIIWLSQLKNFAFSIAAIAVAVVIATKEVILSIIGGLAKGYSQSFRIGDRIDLGGFRGDVINIDLLTTTLLEIGPGNHSHQYTGRSINIPNSLFLSKPVINETYTEDYILHVFSVPISSSADWKRAEQILLESSEETVAEYIEDAKKHMDNLGSKTGLEVPNVCPRVTIVLADTKRYNLLVRVPVPSRRKGKIEQQIIRIFLDRWKQIDNNSAENSAKGDDYENKETDEDLRED